MVLKVIVSSRATTICSMGTTQGGAARPAVVPHMHSRVRYAAIMNRGGGLGQAPGGE